ASMSYREHTRRLVADAKILYALLDVAVGRETDSAATFWDEAWLPERLHALFARATVTRDGRTLPLIRSERTLLESRFPAPRAKPPAWAPYYAAIGLSLGIAIALIGHLAASGRRAFRIALGGLYFVLGTSLGLLALALCYLTFFSAHSAAASNYNVLLLPPWLIALSSAGIGVMRGKARALRVAHGVALGALSSSLLALLIHAFSQGAQSNLPELAAVLPLWLGLTLSTRQFDSSRHGRHAQRAPST
ncbi:MAG TPA: hypothetical protein VHM25_15905, partial [Polyangiaceae bacterium]|nr:hypothetical protein [Polyangiaceae bacterium]